MNLKTGILLILFCVALGAIIVGQRLQIRSVAFQAGEVERDLRKTEEQNRVLKLELARMRDPVAMMQRVRDAGIPLLPPEVKEQPVVAARTGGTR